MLNSPRRQQSWFSGLRLQWSALTPAEHLVSACIVLTPLWWLWGWSYLQLALVVGIFGYEFYRTGQLRLSRPSPLVITMTAFSFYGMCTSYFYHQWNGLPLGPRELLGEIDAWWAPASMVWFIQSKEIRVRLKVVAWAFSILVAFMFLLWLGIHVVGQQGNYSPPRSLFGFLTGKSATFVEGAGNSNYLMPYRPDDSSIFGFARYSSFFHGPESFALVTVFISLLALDLKHKLWSLSLLGSAIALLVLSGTRSAWLAFAAIFCLRYLVQIGKSGQLAGVCTVLAVGCFAIFCIPPVTDMVFDSVSTTANTTAELRADSTDTRGEIYRRTIEDIQTSSHGEFLFGHVVSGETVLPGYAPAQVGTHSFYLGSLLYRQGVIGTGLFAVVWGAWLQWLYATREERPTVVFWIMLTFNLTFCVMAFESTVMPILLISATLRQSALQKIATIRSPVL
ncbi:O-antigen ligase family protein [Acaryochloris sp. IP29b_bin.137]|uniref:O-antigen ligase family protein n=1 Tax=Acaryochloris sp. IP29b_bin.137 TaxID=2969217 RepID=UPI0026244A51|nr:O-antigen ligase family protein [Acaryochloris sp. IP29b_bin.137]